MESQADNKPADAGTGADAQVFSADYVKELRNEAKEARLALSEAKKTLSEMQLKEQDAQVKALEEQKRYEELYNQTKTELETYKTKYVEVESLANTYKQEQEARKTALLEKLPESKREIYKALDLTVLEDIVTSLDPKALHSYGAESTNITTPTTLDGLNGEQLAELASKNPALYQNLIKQTLGR